MQMRQDLGPETDSSGLDNSDDLDKPENSNNYKGLESNLSSTLSSAIAKSVHAYVQAYPSRCTLALLMRFLRLFENCHDLQIYA